jgi:DNA adenine methylase
LRKNKLRHVVAKPTPRRTKPKRSKPPFGYYGAKQRLAGRIIRMLPPHNAWVEAFCGSGAITFAKAPAPIEVVNDLDDDIVNLYRLLRTKPQSVIDAVELTPYARREYLESQRWRTQDKVRSTPVERARRFLVRTMMTVNGVVATHSGFSFSSSYSRAGMEARVSRWRHLPQRLQDVADRLRTVRVEKCDARTLLRMFLDRPATLVYLDPPYFVKREHGYTIDAKDVEFHRELLELCRKAKCMILLSGYDTPLYTKMLRKADGWKRVTIDTHTRDTAGQDYSREEVLWQNKHFVRAAKTGKVPIRLTQHERKHHKVNPRRA